MRVVVTGGAGFIGSHVVENLLKSGCEVRVIDSLVTGSIENLKSCCDRIVCYPYSLQSLDASVYAEILDGVDSVVHLAALADIVPSIEDPERYFDNNVVATARLLTAVRASNVRRVVYAASSSCYGADPIVPTTEDSKIDCRYPYALTKRLAEEMVLHWARLYRFECASLRLFNVFGPRARTRGAYGAVLGVFMAQARAGKPITVVGDGTQKRDFIYVNDVARAFCLAAMPGEAQGVFNVSTGKPRAVVELANLVSENQVPIPKRPGEPDVTWGDSSRFQRTFGWAPEISLEEGVALCKENDAWLKDAPVWTVETIGQATKKWFECLSDE